MLSSRLTIPENGGKIAILVSKGASKETMLSAFAKASELRAAGETVLLTTKQKNVKFQKDKLVAEGYNEFIEF